MRAIQLVHVIKDVMEDIEWTRPLERVHGSVAAAGTDTQRILVLTLRRKDKSNGMLMVTDGHGDISYATTPLASMLGYSVKQMKKMDVMRLMSQPFSQLHSQLLRVRAARVPKLG